MKTKTLFQILMAGCSLIAGSITTFGADDALVGWQHDCSSIKDWYDNKTDASFHAKVDQAEPSVIKVTQEGGDTWGKVAYVVKGVDLDKTPMLEVKLTKVDVGSAFKVAVTSSNWSDFFEVIPRSSADGVHRGDIRAASGWSGAKDFNVVLIVEGAGKAAWFDNVRITAK